MLSEYLTWSASSVQQGHPRDPLLCTFEIHDIDYSTKSKYNVWYLNDATIAGNQRSVCEDIKKCSSILIDIDTSWNSSKSELVHLDLDITMLLRETQDINFILENVYFVEKVDVTLLGLPHTSTAIRLQFQHKLSIFKSMTEKLSIFDRHIAYI